MAFELSAPPLTIFSPKSPSPLRSPSEIRFSRWNNANAQPFIRKQRSIKEVEDEIRREKRFGSASRIAENPPNSTTTTNENFKSIGTPSSPSRPSIPGRKSKYSKPPKPNPNPNSDPFHPAFSKPPKVKISKIPAQLTVAGVSVGEDGVSYRIPNAPFEFQYSYTETPKVKPLALREPPFAPFGPTTMPRPWTGRAPLTKKKLPEFDSFKLPPPHKKGVKTVQAPGPYLAGMGPKYVRSREEIMGEPLTEEEVKDLVDGCVRSQRQLNMGRDGFTHNMLDNIHAHWKRRRVCKIKCKGVCTVDMDNVRQQLEEKTGGKIIYSTGGVLFLYRGRNYNFKTRPRFPLMLWKPITPVYPRLIKQLPEGLTIEEAKEMRKRGRILPPIMKLGKNGVYCHLVEHVKEAFEECELVRINCQGMNPSDYRKIGGKLQDLVPCVLLSFEKEHILMWRGRDWKSSLPKLEGDLVRVSTTDDILINPINKADPTVEDDVLVSPINNANPAVECEEKPDMSNQKSSNEDASLEMSKASFRCFTGEDDVVAEETRIFHSASEAQSSADTPASGVKLSANTPAGGVKLSAFTPASGDLYSTVESNDELDTMSMVPTVTGSVTTPERLQRPLDESEFTSAASEHHLGVISTSNGTMNCDRTQVLLEGPQCLTELAPSTSVCLEGVLLLRKQAIEGGSAVILDDASLDAKIVYDRALALAKTAPPGPIFKHGPKRVLVQNVVKQGNVDSEVSEVLTPSGKKTGKRISRNQKLRDFKEVIPDTFPQGSLGVDELAKLLA